jgi:PAS domain S-box-containing protein
MSLFGWFSSIPVTRIRLFGFAMVLVTGLVDYLTIEAFSFSLVFLIPIVIVSWYDGRTYGFVLAVLSIACSLAGEFNSASDPSSFVPVWNALSRLGVFSFVVWMLGLIRESHHLRVQDEIDRYGRILENAVEGIIMLDSKGVVRDVNARAAIMLGYSTGEFIGKPYNVVIKNERSKDLVEAWRVSNHIEDRKPVEILFEKKDGSVCWTLVNPIITHDRDGVPEGLAMLAVDVSEWKRAEEELQRQYKHLSALQRLSSTLAESVHLDARLETALRTVLEVTGFEAGTISLVDKESGDLILRHHSGLDESLLQIIRRWPADAGVTGQVNMTGQAQFLDNVENSRVFDERVRRAANVRGFAAIPLCAKDKVMGVLNIMSLDSHTFRPDEQALLRACGDQIGVALENAVLYEAAREKAREVSRLSINLVRIQEEERKRFARELHDGLAQLLMTTRVNTELALASLDDSRERTEQHLRETIALVTEAEHEAKQISYDLRPAILDDFGLKAAVETFVRKFKRRSGIEVDLHLPVHDFRFDSIIETTVYRIIQELLANAKKHSHATLVTIQVLVRQDILAVTVADNGIGFNVNGGFPRTPDDHHSGLRNIRERVQSLGGTFRIESSKQKGTECMVEIPCTPFAVGTIVREDVRA